MELIKETKIDFLKYKFIFMGISAVIIVAGLLMIWKNGLKYGVDFSGGTAIHVKFRKPVALDEVRNALKQNGFKDSGVQGFSDVTQMLIRIPQALSDADAIEAMSRKIAGILSGQVAKSEVPAGKNDLNDATPGEINGYLQARDPWGMRNPNAYTSEVGKITELKKANGGLLPSLDQMKGVDARVLSALQEKYYVSDVVILSNEYVGPQVGSELRKQAQLAIIWSLIGLMVYVWFRFQLTWGVAAIICLLHDVMVTLSFFAFTGREISLTVVAAFLTIVGFSLNDTIVIYDRVRDNLKIMKTQPFPDVINFTMNQMLNRTLLTNGTVTIVTLVLFFFGGEVINDFSFAMLVGCVSGTYSTIYIAAALIVLYVQYFGKKKTTQTAKAKVTSQKVS